ncbi:MAG TPA: DUF951 domain-containing protein [Candidatus Angelobacter sp.]|nr:DUF951 domain-containing protein [Candidatus Angelobacter sp.]
MWEPAVGAVVRLKRAHPCGSDRFVVTMVGLDIRLSCAGCGAWLILTRARLQSRLRVVEQEFRES